MLNQNKPYPKLMYSKTTQRIFYMTADNIGTVVKDDRLGRKSTVGEYSHGWNMDCLIDYEGVLSELRYIYEGEKETISLQNDNLPLRIKPQ